VSTHGLAAKEVRRYRLEDGSFEHDIIDWRCRIAPSER
jgi:hypothetical protein